MLVFFGPGFSSMSLDNNKDKKMTDNPFDWRVKGSGFLRMGPLTCDSALFILRSRCKLGGDDTSWQKFTHTSINKMAVAMLEKVHHVFRVVSGPATRLTKKTPT